MSPSTVLGDVGESHGEGSRGLIVEELLEASFHMIKC